jgi:putative nucleotidyltransferase with HDIG domain
MTPRGLQETDQMRDDPRAEPRPFLGLSHDVAAPAHGPFRFCAIIAPEGPLSLEVVAVVRAAAGEHRLAEVLAADGRLTVLATVPCRALAWLWAERLRDRLAAFGFVAVGLAWQAAVRSQFELINRADHAVHRAAERRRVCTWDMVASERVAESLRLRTGWTPSLRRDEMLRRRWPLLGPTQRQHVTVHCELVSETSGALARAMGLDEAETARARLAGLLHDLGKAVIPDELLARPAALTPEDRLIMDRHAEEGSHLSVLLGADEGTRDAVRLHHTRYDAPEWRSEDGATLLPVAARILAVADALVTMTTDRAYRRARTLHEALAELMRQRGVQLDPDVVAAAFRLERVRLARAA